MESLTTLLMLGYWVGVDYKDGGHLTLCQVSCCLCVLKSDTPYLPSAHSQNTLIIINIINKKRGKLLNVKYAKFLSELAGQFINAMA